MNRKVLNILLIMCYGSASFARPVVVRDSARSEEPVVITEPFNTAQSGIGYGDRSYTGVITWQLKNGKVDNSYSMFGSDNNCAILKGTDMFSVQEASSLTSEKIQGLREVRCKMKRSVSTVSLAIYISADQTNWLDITAKYPIIVIEDNGSHSFKKEDLNDEINGLIPATAASATYTFSITLPRDTDVYVRWIVYNGVGSKEKYAFIDDVEFVTYPWVYTQQEEEVSDYVRTTDADHQIGIVCWPQAVHKTDYAGATFYEVAYRVGTAELPTDLVVSEVDDLEAGVPYLYIASGSAITADGYGELTDMAQHRNGLYGALTKIDDSEVLDNKWVLYQNELWQIDPSSTASIKANSGYIDMTEVPAENSFTPVPGRKYRGLCNRDATGWHESWVQTQATKILINGKLVVMKEGHQYDVLGRKQK